MTPSDFISGKRVIVVGLGLLGGGVATTNWLVNHGAEVTVTDLRSRQALRSSLRALGQARKKVGFRIGERFPASELACDILVINPAVPPTHPLVKAARAKKIPIENELTLFLRFCKNPLVGVTGTRGKTTTATWIHHLVRQKFPAAELTGNTAANPLLGILDKLDGRSPVIAELSSFQLWPLSFLRQSPAVAVVTNLMRDHLNYHGTMRSYAEAKAQIARFQKPGDALYLNKRRPWSSFFASRAGGKVRYFYPKTARRPKLPVRFSVRYGEHTIELAYAAADIAHRLGVSWDTIESRLRTFPVPTFRQEVMRESKDLLIVNDSASTMPDATIVAIERFFSRGELILIAGGTDKELSYDTWAGIVEQRILPENLILLSGSATEKMKKALMPAYRQRVAEYGNLRQCVREAQKRASRLNRAVVLFSPGAASFEKFANEFHRGEEFSRLAKSSDRRR